MFVCVSSLSWCEPTARPHLWLQVNFIFNPVKHLWQTDRNFSAGSWWPKHLIWTLFLCFTCHQPASVFWSQYLSSQFYRVPFPAHGCAGSSWWHALRTFCHIPPQPFLDPQLFTLQLSVALGVRRLGTKSQPARGAVFQRLHALLRESPKTELGSTLVRGVTRSLQPHEPDWLLPFSCQTAVWATYNVVTSRRINDFVTMRPERYCRENMASWIAASCWRSSCRRLSIPKINDLQDF